jgi:chemotaxis signal transduction protein
MNSAANLFDRPVPPEYREELAALIAAAPAKPRSRAGSLLLFQLGKLRLALPARVAAAVAPAPHIARIPHRGGTVLQGLAAFRGEILPCCSLARLLDLPEIDSSASRALILEERPGRRWAAPIDAVIGVRSIPDEPAQQDVASGPIAAHWLAGSFHDEAGVFHLLDSKVLFRQITLATA